MTFTYEAAQKLSQIGRNVIVFYIGDYDPAGVLIDVSIERELREHLDVDIDLDFIRLGITEDQIEEYDLPTKPRKDSERRAQHIKGTVETEAMSAAIMRALVRDSIAPLLSPGALEAAAMEDDRVREYFRGLSSNLPEIAWPSLMNLGQEKARTTRAIRASCG